MWDCGPVCGLLLRRWSDRRHHFESKGVDPRWSMGVITTPSQARRSSTALQCLSSLASFQDRCSPVLKKVCRDLLADRGWLLILPRSAYRPINIHSTGQRCSFNGDTDIISNPQVWSSQKAFNLGLIDVLNTTGTRRRMALALPYSTVSNNQALPTYHSLPRQLSCIDVHSQGSALTLA